MRAKWAVAALLAALLAVAALPPLLFRRPAPVPVASARKAAVPGQPKPTESNVMWGLRWLRDHQDPDGRWRDPATTGMALLAFLGAGETHQSGVYGEVVKKALCALRNGQDADGCLVPRSSPRLLCDHAIAALALVESYGMTGSRAWKDPAQKAVSFALKSRRPGGAWNLPAPDDAEIDVEATAWMSMLLRSATLSEIDANEAALGEVAAALEGLTDPATGRLRVPPRSPAPLSEDAATAIGLLVRIWSGRRPESDALAAKAADALVASPPAADTPDLRRVYFGSVAMLAVAGERFRAWLPALTAFVQVAGRADGPDKGSWDPPDGATPEERIRTTAYHLRCCEFFYGPVGHASMSRRR